MYKYVGLLRKNVMKDVNIYVCINVKPISQFTRSQ